MTPLLSAPALVSAGINSQIKPLPPSPDSRQPNSANGKQMPTASLCVGQPGDKPHRPRDSSCPPGNGGEARAAQGPTGEGGAQAWGRGQGQNGPHLDFTLPPASDGFAFSLLRFQLFPKALPTTVVAVIVSSLFDPLTGTQIHRLAAH